MKRNFVSMTAISLFLVMLFVLLGIQTVEAVIPYVYIRADGSVDPPFAPISSFDNITYTFTNDLYIPVIVERDNIIIDGADHTLSGNGTGRGIDLTNRHNVTIKNLQIRSFQSGIWLQSSNCRVIGNEISNNTYGVWVFGSNNTLYRNTIKNNSDTSIVVDLNSSNNTIYENSIMNSSRGIWLIAASDNKFFHNNFIDNTQHVHGPFSGYANVWDDGYPSGGNYWGGYASVDLYSGLYQNNTGRDGVGDTSYTIDANNTDHYPLMTSYSSIYQGDMVLIDNDVYAVEGRFDINGSIIVEENATLILRNAILNFTQTGAWQYYIALRNPLKGNPHLLVYNSIITSDFVFVIRLNDNSTAEIYDSTIVHHIIPEDASLLSISDSYVYRQIAYDSANIQLHNSTITWSEYYDSTEAILYDSHINMFIFGPNSVNCTLLNIRPGLVSSWNFINDCSIIALPGGNTPNLILINTLVDAWNPYFYGSSNVSIINCTIWHPAIFGSSFIQAVDTAFMQYLHVRGTSVFYLVNSTYSGDPLIQDQAKIQVAWYLDVYVVDSNGTSVPSANVNASYPNATISESKLTDANGWAMLTLMEKMMNTTGTYSVGNYTIEATYETYSDSTTVNMTENKQITIQLPFIIPEFSSLIILPLFIMTTLIAVLVYKRKYTARF